MQRVSAIDRIFDGEQKKYLCDATSIEEKANLMISASMIYVQSIYMAKDILPLYAIFADKIITDLHGVVPEEEAYQGKKDVAEEMERVEAEVFKYGKFFVAVTQSMVDHFVAKYNLDNGVTWMVLPIFDIAKPEPRVDRADHKLQVIYAGGMQRWQNPSLMEQAVLAAKGYDYIFYTHEPDKMSDISAKTTDISVIIKSGSKEEVFEAYRKADLGLLLRDNHILNKVSCPTKLVEYVNFGVVPIVLSSDIGDFHKLGYSYITYGHFVNEDVDKELVAQARENNYRVAKKLKNISDKGIENIRQLLITFRGNFKTCDEIVMKNVFEVFKSNDLIEKQNALVQKIGELNNNISNQQKTITEQQKTITEQQKSITEQQKTITEQQRIITNMLNSKRWKFGELINNPSNLARYLRKLIQGIK